MERVINSPSLSDGEKITLLENAIIAGQTRMIDMDGTLQKHHKLLVEGNGELPIMERVRNLETFSRDLKFWLRTIAVALVIQIIAMFAAGIAYFVKLYPVLERLSNPI